MPVAGLLDDAQSHPPPSAGDFAYNTFLPGSPIGTSYAEPIFGNNVVVRRVTNDGVNDDTYARNMWWNADESRYFHFGNIINVNTNTVEYTGVPRGGVASGGSNDEGFDPVDPNVYYYYNSLTIIKKITLGAGGTWEETNFFTAPSNLKSLGSTWNWWDRTGRYFLVRYGTEPSVYLYDSEDIGAGAYANPIDGSNIESARFVGLTPDGAYLVMPITGGQGPGSSEFRRWAVNHGTRTIASGSGTIFWSCGGDHGVLVSASNGNNYLVAGDDSGGTRDVWKVLITNNAAGLTAVQQQAQSGNASLFDISDPSFTKVNHFSAVAIGDLKDWAFVGAYDTSDTFGSSTSPWQAYRQEIIAVNVVTNEVRRLAHHRSRSPGADYYYSPRISSSWKGKWVSWASNFNVNAANNVNIYAVQFNLDQTCCWFIPLLRPVVG